jgi:hypothetical protein
VSEIVKQSNKSDYMPLRPNQTGELLRRVHLGGFALHSYTELPVPATEILANGVDKLIYLLKDAHDVVNPGVRRIDENSISQTELPQSIKALHSRGVEHFQLRAR